MKNKQVNNVILGGLCALIAFCSFMLISQDFLIEATLASARLATGEVPEVTVPPEDEKIDLNRKTDIFEELIKFSAPDYSEQEFDTEEETDTGEEQINEPETTGDGKIIRKTYAYETSASCRELPFGGLLRNNTDIDTDYLLDQCLREPNADIHIDDEPLVLIMHTHTTECYEDTAKETYNAQDEQRTTDLSRSVVAVGEVIANMLEEKGIGVIHDVAMHDYPNYNGAYDRSSERVEEILAEYPSIQIVLDVHRDAIESDGVRYAPVATIDGKSCAQVMIICGNVNVPQYRYNLRFASRLQSKMETLYPGLTRPLLFSERNYNQELTKNSFLIEMGSNSNSLDEALYAGELVGVALAELIMELDADF